MWLIVLMSGKWHARDYGGEKTLRYNIDVVFEAVNAGNVICIADDLETWCDEMGVDQSEVIVG